MKILKLIACAAIAVSAISEPVYGAYPDRPVKIVVGFAAGGPADITARLAAKILSDKLHQQFVIENKAGAGGGIATAQVLKAAPDGYTLLLAAFADVLNPIMNPQLPYRLSRDFTPVTRITGVGNVLVTHPGLPVSSVAELIAYGKAHPGELNYGSAGVGSASHLAGELFASLAGIKATHIPYRGTAQAQVASQQGSVQFMFDSLISALPNYKAGKVRALAVTTSLRSSGAPEIPTVAEQGLPTYDLTSWFGLAAPAGTPQVVVDTLAQALREGLKDKEARQALLTLGGLPDDMSPGEFGRYIRAEEGRWAALFDQGRIKIEK